MTLRMEKKAFDVNIASKQIWSLNQAMSLVDKAQLTLDEIENGNMSPMSDIGFIQNFYVINLLILL